MQRQKGDKTAAASVQAIHSGFFPKTRAFRNHGCLADWPSLLRRRGSTKHEKILRVQQSRGQPPRPPSAPIISAYGWRHHRAERDPKSWTWQSAFWEQHALSAFAWEFERNTELIIPAPGFCKC